MGKLRFKSLSFIICTLLILILTPIIKPQEVQAQAVNAVSVDATKYNLDITGVKDTSATFQKMIDSFPKGSTLNLPKGIYKFDNTVDLKDGITLVASGDVIIIGAGTNTLFNTGNSDTFNGIRIHLIHSKHN